MAATLAASSIETPADGIGLLAHIAMQKNVDFARSAGKLQMIKHCGAASFGEMTDSLIAIHCDELSSCDFFDNSRQWPHGEI
jgi:hypothetical protein